jgi:hypothetical protein
MIAVALIIAVVVGMWLRNFISQDKCLDSGGRWNATTRACVH